MDSESQTAAMNAVDIGVEAPFPAHAAPRDVMPPDLARTLGLSEPLASSLGDGRELRRGRLDEASALRDVAGKAVALFPPLALLASLGFIASREAFVAFRHVDRCIWVGIPIAVLTVAMGVRARSRWATLVAVLAGLPLELPFWPLGSDRSLCSRRATWLVDFLAEKPRGYNTPGGHLACGVIGVKIALKKLCLRAERRDRDLKSLHICRSHALALRNRFCDQAASALATGDRAAIETGKRAHTLDADLARIDDCIRQRRLCIQRGIVGLFLEAWATAAGRDRISREALDAVVRQLSDAEGACALLPNGLVRGPGAFALEYGLFLGRLAAALLFLGSLQTSHVGVAIVLLLLELYVVEPVILKIHIAVFNVLLESSGHKAVDLALHLREAFAVDAVFRVPIAVPKKSTNPAWSSLNSIIQAVARRRGIRLGKVTPFAMRKGLRDTVIELDSIPNDNARAKATADFRRALESELRRNKAALPLETETRVREGRVVVAFTGADGPIWDLIGEDASQAFTYLWRNVRALRDTLSHVGTKFRPVFILASNTSDADVIRFEKQNLMALQDWSNREYDGQVGFLYLVRGGQWLDFNAHRWVFDGADGDFAKAVSHFVRRLEETDVPAKAWLIDTLNGGRDAAAFAAVFNMAMRELEFYRHFDGVDLAALPAHLRPSVETIATLERARRGVRLTASQRRRLNRELLLTAMPVRISNDFFKKVGNDIALQELLVKGRSKPVAYTDRSRSEHVQDPDVPSYMEAWGDFARYTGLAGSSEEIRRKILAGETIEVESVPVVGAIADDKNDFAPGEIEKAVATMLHPDNAHVVIGVPRIYITLPRRDGITVSSQHIAAARADRDTHNAADARSRSLLFGASSPAYGKWWLRPEPYLGHFEEAVINPAHALSHDFQQSYLITGAAGRLVGFTEALYGPSRFRLRPLRSVTRERPARTASSSAADSIRALEPLAAKAR